MLTHTHETSRPPLLVWKCWLLLTEKSGRKIPCWPEPRTKSTLCHCPTGQSWPFSAWDIYYRRWEQYYPYYRPTNPSQPRHSLWLHWLRSVQRASAHVEKCPQIGGAVMSGDISDPAKLRAGPLPHWVMPRRRKTAGWAPGYCHVGLVFQKGGWGLRKWWNCERAHVFWQRGFLIRPRRAQKEFETIISSFLVCFGVLELVELFKGGKGAGAVVHWRSAALLAIWLLLLSQKWTKIKHFAS